MKKFLEIIGIDLEKKLTIQERCKIFAHKVRSENGWLVNVMIQFLQYQKNRVTSKEISGSTLRNYVLDWKKVRPLILKPEETSVIVELAPIIDGKPHVDKISISNIEQLGKKFRLQSSSFRIARDVFESFEPNWKGNKDYLLLQIVKVVEQFIRSDKLRIPNTLFGQELRERVLIALNMNKIVHHIWGTITFQNISRTTLVFDKEKPIRSTADMLPWYTTRVAENTRKSHISHAVLDSKFEQATVFEFEINADVKSS